METWNDINRIARESREATSDFKEAVKRAEKEEAEFRDLLPTTGFFHYYMRYTDRQESPDSYHFWVAATVIAGALQRRVWLSKGVYHIFPNLYTVLVGPSGVTRKSRAIKMGTELLEPLDFANVIADKTTPESLLEAMQFGAANVEIDSSNPSRANILPESSAFIRASELSVFLNKSTYTTGMVSLLTDLYDSPNSFKYQTRTQKPIKLRNVSVNFLGASTPEWLATNIPEAAFEGGFMSRVIFIVRHMRSRFIPFPEEPEHGQTEALRQALANIRHHAKGEMQLTSAARAWFDQWYIRHETTDRASDYNLLGFVERKPDTIIKLAMILSLAENPKAMMIDDRHFEQAETIVSWTQQHMFRAFEDVDVSHIGGFKRRIIKMLEANGGTITRRAVMRALSSRISSVRDLDEIERMFEETGEVTVHKNITGRGRPSVTYRLNNKELLDEE